MEILNGKLVSEEILNKIKKRIETEKLNICLAIILIGDDAASQIYVKGKINACEKVGIKTKLLKYNNNISEKEIIDLIQELNQDENIQGIILQSPTPKFIDFNKCSGLISSLKDVDGLTKNNIYNNYMNQEGFLPCTVKGIIKLLEKYNISLSGKNIVIVGRGNLVGKPLYLALLNKNATVTLCHSHTKNLKKSTRIADIVISAVGKANLITKDMIKDKGIVIDVGITRLNNCVVGDVDYKNVSKKCSYITPTPGGVGPMTIAMIIENTLEAYERNIKNG